MYGDQFGEFVWGYWGLKGFIVTCPARKQLDRTFFEP